MKASFASGCMGSGGSGMRERGVWGGGGGAKGGAEEPRMWLLLINTHWLMYRVTAETSPLIQDQVNTISNTAI